jgi:hypothetical protein
MVIASVNAFITGASARDLKSEPLRLAIDDTKKFNVTTGIFRHNADAGASFISNRKPTYDRYCN